jgi:hypothetical protein
MYQIIEFGWTETHAFFLEMGGFVICEHDTVQYELGIKTQFKRQIAENIARNQGATLNVSYS